MASLRSDLTRRRSRNAGGIIPSWLKSRKLSDKEKAWKAHVESRVPYMRDLKNKLDQREKVCGDKESKKAKSIMKNLTKASKLAEVSKFIKHLAELSKLIKEWDQRVITYATDLGKTCGMFTVVPEQSTIVKFIKERIDYENTKDPDNYTWEVRPELKPGIAVEVPAKKLVGPLRGPDGRFVKRVDVERKNRDDVRKIINRRVIDTRAEDRARELLAAKKDKENRLAILISDLKAGERLRNSDIKFLKELGLYIEDDTNKIYYIEDDTNKIYYLEDDRRYPDSLIKLLKNEAEKYDIYNRLPSRRRVLDKDYDGRYAGRYDGMPYDWGKERDEEKARKARKERALVKYDLYDRKKRESPERVLVKKRESPESAIARLRAHQARINEGVLEEDDFTRPIPSHMRRKLGLDDRGQSAERIQQEWDMANQSPEDEKKKTSKPLVGNLGAQTEETENGPEKVDSGTQSEEKKKGPGLLSKAVGVVTEAVSGVASVLLPKSAEQKAAEEAAEDERLRTKLRQDLRDMAADTQGLSDTTPPVLSDKPAQPVRDSQPESGVDAALGDAFSSRGKSNDSEAREARRKAREIAAETRERENREINETFQKIREEVLAEDIPPVAREALSESTTMPPQPPTLPPRTRQFPPSSQKEGSPSPYSRPEKVDAEVQSVEEQKPNQNLKHAFDIAAHETAAKAYETTKRREQNEASTAKRESLYEQDQLEMSKRVNEILDEAVQNNAIEQQRAETAEEESDLNKALYESSQQLFEDNKSRHTKDILHDIVEKIPELSEQKKENSQMNLEDATYPRRKTSPPKTIITMSNPQSMPPPGPTEELRIPPGPTERKIQLQPTPLRTRFREREQDRRRAEVVADYARMPEERKEEARIALEKNVGFIGDPLEPTSPTKVFKPLNRNPEDIGVSNSSAQNLEDEEVSMNRYMTEVGFKDRDDERKGIAEAQTKPPFAG